MKTITNENKYKAALQYYGCDFLLCFNIENNPVIEKFTDANTAPDLYEPDYNNKRDKRELLILKPLSAISDKDAADLIRNSCLNGFDHSVIINGKIETNNKVTSIWHIFGGAHYVEYIHEGNISLNRGQFLQSRGYDLPSYYLGGQTLKEAGLAIYNN